VASAEPYAIIYILTDNYASTLIIQYCTGQMTEDIGQCSKTGPAVKACFCTHQHWIIFMITCHDCK